MKRLLVSLSVLALLTSCTWIPSGGGTGGSMGAGPSLPSLKEARLEANTALPGQAVTVSGVPEALGDVTATFEPASGGEAQPMQVRRADSTKVTLPVPLSPLGLDQASEVDVTLEGGGQTSPKLRLRILALPPLDPAAARKLGQNAYILPVLAAQHVGIAIDHAALEGDPAPLPEALRPVALIHAILSDPSNPYSLRALLDGTSALDQDDPATAEVTRRLFQSSGFIEALSAHNAARRTTSAQTDYRTFGRYFASQRETSLHEFPDLRVPLSPQVLSNLLQNREKLESLTDDRGFKGAAYAFDTASFIIGWTGPQVAAMMSMLKFGFDLANDLQLSLLPAGYRPSLDDPVFTRPLRDNKGKLLPYPHVTFKVEESEEYAEWSDAMVIPVTGTTSIDIGKGINLICAGRTIRDVQKTVYLDKTLNQLRLMSQKLKVDGWLVFDTYLNPFGLYQVFGELPGIVSTRVMEYRPVDVTPYCSIYQPQVNNIRTMAGNRRRFAVGRGKRGLLKLGLFSDGLYLGQAMEQTSGAIAGGTRLVEHCLVP